MDSVILKILILGGTHFLGIHLTEELLSRGHEVTLFNRGTQKTDLFLNVENLQGDRDGHLEALLNRKWDAVIDTSGHLPRIVEQSAKILSQAANHYTFISTIGVYDNFLSSNIDESYPVAKIEDPLTEAITEKNYGALKALCEEVIEKYFPHRALIVRSGLLVGPYDPSDRFTYWIRRIEKGGKVLAPSHQPAQFIDARDMARWIVRMIEKQATGIYNATGPSNDLEYVLKECKKTINQSAEIVWVDEDFLIKQDVKDWAELPLWLSKQRGMPGFLKANNQKAIQSGLHFRPLQETFLSILEWDRFRGETKLQAGLDPQREKELLREWEVSQKIAIQ